MWKCIPRAINPSRLPSTVPFPTFFFKRKWPFAPLPSQISPAAHIIDPPTLLGGAARPESATLTVTIIHAWSGMVVDVPGVSLQLKPATTLGEPLGG